MEEHHCCFYSKMLSRFSISSFMLSLVIVLVVRVLYVMYQCGKPFPKGASRSFTTLIVLGSGGHTAEMLSLLSVLRMDRFTPRFYIAAATDNMSLHKARSFEDSLADKPAVKEDSLQYTQIYRSREVGQSYVTSVWTTILATVHALWLMIRIRPQVILCNGPGTCIPLCVIAFLFKVVGIRWSSIFYVESVARVKKLSLSGLLLYRLRLADQFFVQWPQLQNKYPRAHYVAIIGTTGSPNTLIAFENREESSKISPVPPMLNTCQANERKPHIAKTMEKIFSASILSWKTIAATTGTIGNPTAVTVLENTEDDSKINPTAPIV
ncbi:hypothetical protein HID58_041024 [Brassica napus]|uniref:UDP-N-acetylglucosamine transferase subunit ALG14 n=1 Tax=Brassica napus TaxID=3708 RepID=A0ABQ8BBA7_BRANA|nr:hypothetical protein HID58_041024 [Brassica napus]